MLRPTLPVRAAVGAQGERWPRDNVVVAGKVLYTARDSSQSRRCPPANPLVTPRPCPGHPLFSGLLQCRRAAAHACCTRSDAARHRHRHTPAWIRLVNRGSSREPGVHQRTKGRRRQGEAMETRAASAVRATRSASGAWGARAWRDDPAPLPEHQESTDHLMPPPFPPHPPSVEVIPGAKQRFRPRQGGRCFVDV